MKIILANGKELNPIMVTGGGKFISGQKRDTLNFIFPADAKLEELDAIFTDANCETIKLYENVTNADGTVAETEHIHTGYTIRAGLYRAPMVVQPATETTEEVIENRVTVAMAQRTYAESKLAELASQTAMLEECIVELACDFYA